MLGNDLRDIKYKQQRDVKSSWHKNSKQSVQLPNSKAP